MLPRLNVSFTLTGQNFDPEIVSQTIGLVPTKTWRFGDPIARISKMKYDGWKLSMPQLMDVDMPLQLQQLLAILSPHAEAINFLRNKHSLDAEFNCVAYVADETPIIHFDRDILYRVSQLGAEIDVDVMLVAE